MPRVLFSRSAYHADIRARTANIKRSGNGAVAQLQFLSYEVSGKQQVGSKPAKWSIVLRLH